MPSMGFFLCYTRCIQDPEGAEAVQDEVGVAGLFGGDPAAAAGGRAAGQGGLTHRLG